MAASSQHPANDGYSPMIHAFLFSALAVAGEQPVYRVVKIPVPIEPGAQIATITDDGVIAFTAQVGSDNGAFLWDRVRGLRQLRPLSGHVFAYVADLQPNGEALGHSQGTSGQDVRAVAWSSDGMPRELRSPVWAARGRAESMNRHDQAVGIALRQPGGWLPVLWSHDVLSLLPRPAGSHVATALAVNSNGVVVGDAGNPGPSSGRPVVWISPSTPLLPTLPPGMLGGALLGVNDADESVGYGFVSGAQRPLRCDGLSLRLLENPTGFHIGVLTKINRNGTAIGYAHSASTQWRGIVALGDDVLLIDQLVDPVTMGDWRIHMLGSINNREQIAAIGYRLVPVIEHAILLLDPMP